MTSVFLEWFIHPLFYPLIHSFKRYSLHVYCILGALLYLGGMVNITPEICTLMVLILKWQDRKAESRPKLAQHIVYEGGEG